MLPKCFAVHIPKNKSDTLRLKTSTEASFKSALRKADSSRHYGAEPCYLVTSHEAQVAEGLAALSDLCGSLVRDVLTPAGIHGLYGTAVLAYGYQSCGHRRKTEGRGGGRWGWMEGGEGEKQEKVLV